MTCPELLINEVSFSGDMFIKFESISYICQISVFFFFCQLRATYYQILKQNHPDHRLPQKHSPCWLTRWARSQPQTPALAITFKRTRVLTALITHSTHVSYMTVTEPSTWVRLCALWDRTLQCFKSPRYFNVVTTTFYFFLIAHNN